MMFKLTIQGTVSSISGSTITLTGKNGTAYTIDASNATILKMPKTTIQLADIKVGETLKVSGTVSGTNVTAKKIVDGVQGKENHASLTVGKVTAINGSSITITSKNGTVYTVDASNATFAKFRKTKAQLSDIKVGDSLRIYGTVSGTNITATKVVDGTGAKHKVVRRNPGKHLGSRNNPKK